MLPGVNVARRQQPVQRWFSAVARSRHRSCSGATGAAVAVVVWRKGFAFPAMQHISLATRPVTIGILRSRAPRDFRKSDGSDSRAMCSLCCIGGGGVRLRTFLSAGLLLFLPSHGL